MLTYVYTYYENPQMLAEQYKLWASYPRDLKEKIEIIIVDDASPVSPAYYVPRPEGLPKLRMYRVHKDIPWHQDGARNLGAHAAAMPWLFLCDMDHLIPERTLRGLTMWYVNGINESLYYTFSRVEMNGRPTLDTYGNPKYGPNILCMMRSLYWHVGGYDEDLCGWYGTDGQFKRRLNYYASRKHLNFDIPVIRVGTDTVADCNTRTYPRKGPENDAIKEKLVQLKLKRGRAKHIAVLEFEWTQQI
jgi:hypothetical protein